MYVFSQILYKVTSHDGKPMCATDIQIIYFRDGISIFLLSYDNTIYDKISFFKHRTRQIKTTVKLPLQLR